MVTSNDAAWLGRVRQMANHGAGDNRYDNVVLGTNSRLDALQAAILRVKLRHLDAWNEERRERVRAYDQALGGLPGVRDAAGGGRRALRLAPLHDPPGRARRAAEAPQGARASPPPCTTRGRSTCSRRWPRPAARPGDLPVSERLSREVLCLPLYPELPLEDR